MRGRLEEKELVGFWWFMQEGLSEKKITSGSQGFVYTGGQTDYFNTFGRLCPNPTTQARVKTF